MKKITTIIVVVLTMILTCSITAQAQDLALDHAPILLDSPPTTPVAGTNNVVSDSMKFAIINTYFLEENYNLFDDISCQINPQLRVLADSVGLKSWTSVKDFLDYRLQNRGFRDWEMKNAKVSVEYEVTKTEAKLWISYHKKSLFIMFSSEFNPIVSIWRRHWLLPDKIITDTKRIEKWVRKLPG